MSNKTTYSFLTLPVELAYQILDHQSYYTIICSMRNVCQRLNRIVDSYPRYQVNYFLLLLFAHFHRFRNHFLFFQFISFTKFKELIELNDKSVYQTFLFFNVLQKIRIIRYRKKTLLLSFFVQFMHVDDIIFPIRHPNKGKKQFIKAF